MTTYDDGMAVRREVLGDEHVDRAEAAKTRVHRRLPGADHPVRLGRDLDPARPRPADAQRGHADRADRARATGRSSRCTCARRARNGLTRRRDRRGDPAERRLLRGSGRQPRVRHRAGACWRDEGDPVTAEVFVYDAVRTPFGRYGGALAGHPARTTSPPWSSARCVERAPGPRPGADRRGRARQRQRRGRGQPQRRPDGGAAGRAADLGARRRRSTGSAARASTPPSSRSRQIALGEADVVVAGGVESMSRAPWVLPKPEKPFPAGDADAGLDHAGLAAGQPADAGRVDGLARRGDRAAARARGRDARGAGRVRAALAPARAAAAWDSGFYDDQVVAVPGVDLARDESIRADTTAGASSPALKPVFRADGTVTAGNASPLNDGASAALLGSRPRPSVLGADPLARIAGRGAAANEPQFFGFAPVEAANLALEARRHRLGRRRRRRAQRGVRRAVARLRHGPGASTRRSSTPTAARSRSATRWAPPAPGSSARSPAPSAALGRALGRRRDLHRRRPGPRRRPRERDGPTR